MAIVRKFFQSIDHLCKAKLLTLGYVDLCPQALYRARLLNNINLETMKAKILLEARDELQATFQKNEAKRNMKTFDIK